MATKTMSWTLVWDVEAAAPSATPSAGDNRYDINKVQIQILSKKQNKCNVIHLSTKK